MRLRVRIIAVVVTALLLFGAVAAADNSFMGFQIVRIILNQQEVESDVPAILFHGRTMLPVRKLAELTGLNVDQWDGDTNTVYLSGPVWNQPVATVNGEAITQQALYDALVAQEGARTLERLIDEMLVDQAAREANITVTEAEIDAEIEKVRQSFGGEAQLQDALRAYGFTMEGLRQNYAFNLKVVKLVGATIPVSDQTLRQFFEENRAWFDERSVHARHILVDTKQEAQAIHAELKAGADFEALARAKSQDPSAQRNGGDLGSFGIGMMVEEFEQVVFNLGVGEISEPFETVFGWHIAQVLGVEGTAPDFEAMREEIRGLYLEEQIEERFGEWMEGLRRRAKITNSLNQR